MSNRREIAADRRKRERERIKKRVREQNGKGVEPTKGEKEKTANIRVNSINVVKNAAEKKEKETID